jgi:His-Xaa-Ser system radical SAM maturase HxsC
MYRRQSRFNSLLLTEQCNSNCIMCSQPPKTADDRFLVDAYRQAIPLMAKETVELGITGGEPTLLGSDLWDLLTDCRDHLPDTDIHMLTNGRRFSSLETCRSLASIAHPGLVLGIPVYSDLAALHDFVVQAAGAFDQTIRGLLNLTRFGIRIEVRVVLQRHTVGRLPQLARFLCRNCPFIEHVALMGLELMGYARGNLEAIWIDPVDYQASLRDAVDVMAGQGLNVSIYNHQLCVLDRELWPFARQSISDWKNEYLPACAECAVESLCGGFFASSKRRLSRGIAAIHHSEFTAPVTAVE